MMLNIANPHVEKKFNTIDIAHDNQDSLNPTSEISFDVEKHKGRHAY